MLPVGFKRLKILRNRPIIIRWRQLILLFSGNTSNTLLFTTHETTNLARGRKLRRVKAAGLLAACWPLGRGTYCLPYGRNRRIRGARTRHGDGLEGSRNWINSVCSKMNPYCCATFKVLTAVPLIIRVSLDVTLCCRVNVYRHFEGLLCFHFQV